MSTLVLSQLINETPAFLHRIGSRISAFLDGIDEARMLAGRFKSLSRMSDAELAARGIKREDIPQAVFSNR